MPRKQIERVWLFGVVVAAALLVLVGYTMFISSQNAKTSSARSQVSTAQVANRRLQSRLDNLREQSKNLAKYQGELIAAQSALPATSGLPDFLRTLQSIGNATLTSVSSLTVGPPTDVTPIAGAAVNRAGSTSASGSSAKSSGTVATASGGTGRIYTLPISASVTGSSSALDAFLVQLQTVQPRAVLISQLSESSGQATAGSSGGHGTTTTGAAPGTSTLTLTMQAFVAPASTSEQTRLATASGK